jgi:hypothetical protein
VSTSKLQTLRANAHGPKENRTQSNYCRKSSGRRLLEIEKWAVDQQQYNRPFAHFGVFNGHTAQTSAREDIVSRSAHKDWSSPG